MVIEVPPGLQGILDDFWQRPIPRGRERGRTHGWATVGSARAGQGKGRKLPVLPPDYKGEVPKDEFIYRTRNERRIRLLADVPHRPKQI